MFIVIVFLALLHMPCHESYSTHKSYPSYESHPTYPSKKSNHSIEQTNFHRTQTGSAGTRAGPTQSVDRRRHESEVHVFITRTTHPTTILLLKGLFNVVAIQKWATHKRSCPPRMKAEQLNSRTIAATYSVRFRYRSRTDSIWTPAQ